MYCRNCGHILTDGRQLCEKCGRRGRHTDSAKKWRDVAACVVMFACIVVIGTGCGRMQNENSTAEVSGYSGTTIDEVQESMSEIHEVALTFADKNGYVPQEYAEEAINAVYEAALEKPCVVECSKDEYGVYIAVEEGLDYVYMPEIEGEDTGGSELNIVTMQPYYTENKERNPDYDHDGLDICAEDMISSDSRWNFRQTSNLDDEKVSLDQILKIDDYKMILWHGHGGYSKETGYYLCTTIEVTKELLNEYSCINKNNALIKLGNSLCLKPEFFAENYEDDAFENAFIYLATCYSGKDTEMAEVLIDKGAAVVFVNSKTISREYNLNMLHMIVESFCLGGQGRVAQKAISRFGDQYSFNTPEHWNISDSLYLAKQVYGGKDLAVIGAEVYYVGTDNVDTLTYAQWMEGFEDIPESVEQEQSEVTKETLQNMVNDIAARGLVYMFTKNNCGIRNAYQYDFDFDGAKDWVLSLDFMEAAHSFWMLIPSDGEGIMYFVTDSSAAGGVSLLLSDAIKDIVVVKDYNTAGYGMESFWPLFGASFADMEYEWISERDETVATYKVDGATSDKDHYEEKLESMGLKSLEARLPSADVFTTTVDLSTEQLDEFLNMMSEVLYVSEYCENDINGDGITDAMIIAGITDGRPYGVQTINEYGLYDPNEMDDWSECGILIQSTETGAEIRVCDANEIRKLDAYREVMTASEELVSDGYYCRFLGHNSSYNSMKEYHIPQININSAEVSAINGKILDICAEEISDYERASENDYSEIYYIDYEWSINGNTLSLLMWRESIHEYIYYYVYNVSLDSGTQVSQSELLNQAGITETEYRAQAKQAMGSKFWSAMGPDVSYEYNEMLQRTISENNIDSAQPYMNDKGELCIACIIYVPAGGGRMPVCINLEDYEVPDYYAEEIARSENNTVVSTKYVVNVPNSIYLRSSPEESDNNIITTIPVHEAVGVIEDSNNKFSRVEYNGNYGYVKTEFLADEPMPHDGFSDDWPNGTYTLSLQSLYLPQSGHWKSEVRGLARMAYSLNVVEELNIGDLFDIGTRQFAVESIEPNERGYAINTVYQLAYNAQEDTYYVETPAGYAYTEMEEASIVWADNATIENPNSSGADSEQSIEEYFLVDYTYSDARAVLEITIRDNVAVSAVFLQWLK